VPEVALVNLAEIQPEIIGLGGLIALLQVLSMIFRKRGESDPMMATIAAAIDHIKDEQIASGKSLVQINEQIVSYNTRFQEQVLRQQMRDQAIDERITDLDEVLRGNGTPGLREQVRNLEARIRSVEGKRRTGE
jgi:hypothetical protein